MDAAEASGTGIVARVRRPISQFDRGERIRMVVIAVLFLFVILILPGMLSTYWTDVATAVAIYTIVALGLSLLMGRVGLVSLGQVAVLALGAWVGARLLFATGLPFPVVTIMTGLITMVLGSLIGLPALRVSGLYLALITLMLAGAITVLLATTDFPNGGGGFLGHTEATTGAHEIRRPSIATGEHAYFRYVVVWAGLMFLLALWHVRGKPGRAWATIRQSEPAALAAGVNISLYKMWAFALASFMTGIAGALLAGSSGTLYNLTFPTQDSIILLAVVLMGGIYSLWGAVVAGILIKLLPALLDNWGLPPDLLTILFGIGVIQVLTTAPAGLVDQFPKDMARLGRFLWRLVGSPGRRATGTAGSK
ncbi:MAG TPA: branched-chain amino acid ABC transporter permease [Solirubrobacterales bacterium]|jgi:branched-chain amino acid transport system permease protein